MTPRPILWKPRTDVSASITQSQIDNLPINGRNYINFTLLQFSGGTRRHSIDRRSTRQWAELRRAAGALERSFRGRRRCDRQLGERRALHDLAGRRAGITGDYEQLYARVRARDGRRSEHRDRIRFQQRSRERIRLLARQRDSSPRSIFRHCFVQPRHLTCGITPVKQSYTRVQGGATIGGPIQKDKTFYFFSYEITRRQETGFTNIGADNFGLALTPAPADIVPFLPPGVPTAGLLTVGSTGQQAFVNNAANNFAQRISVYSAGVGASAVALFGNTGLLPGPANIFPSSGAPLRARIRDCLPSSVTTPRPMKAASTR